MRIAPHIGGGLTHVRATHDTVRGRVSIEWAENDGDITVRVAIPNGTTAGVKLPRHPDKVEHSVGGGHHEWTYAAVPAQDRLTPDSPVECLAGHDSVFSSVVRILQDHLPPHLDVRQLLDQSASLPFSVFLSDLPGLSDHVCRELTAMIENHN
jgi:alpha-L-rhamnosidase